MPALSANCAHPGAWSVGAGWPSCWSAAKIQRIANPMKCSKSKADFFCRRMRPVPSSAAIKILWVKNIQCCLALMVLLGMLPSCSNQSPFMSGADFQRYSASAKQVASVARSLIGTPYRRNGSSPQTGFDCSGLVVYVYRMAGVDLPRSTEDLSRMRAPGIKKNELREGDLLYFSTKRYSREVSHVGIYIGDGFFIHAPSSGKTVNRASLADKYWQKNYRGANRPLLRH